MKSCTLLSVTPSKNLVVFVGLQASGKSSFYRRYFLKTHRLISKDLWPNAKHKESRQQRLLENALSEGHPVVIDNTNPGIIDREPLIALGKKYQANIVGYYFASRISDCLARNQKRTGKKRVPDVAIFATAKKLELPSFEEGFTQLFYVKCQEDQGSFLIKPWQEE